MRGALQGPTEAPRLLSHFCVRLQVRSHHDPPPASPFTLAAAKMSEPSSAAHAHFEFLKSRTKCPHKKKEYEAMQKALGSAELMQSAMDGIKATGEYHKASTDKNKKAEDDAIQELKAIEATDKTARKRDSPGASDSVAPDSDDGPAAKAPRLDDDAATSPMGTFLATYQTPAPAAKACLAASSASTMTPAPASTTTPQYALMNGAINGAFAPPEAPSDNEVFKKNLGTSLIKFRPYHHPKPGEPTCEFQMHLRKEGTANAGAASIPQQQRMMSSIQNMMLEAFRASNSK